MFLLAACSENFNSNYGDAAQCSVTDTLPENVRLAAACGIIKNRCFQCHSPWAAYNTTQKWVNAGLVVRGSYTGSQFVISLKNHGGNMPPDPHSQISPDELISIQNWIQNL